MRVPVGMMPVATVERPVYAASKLTAIAVLALAAGSGCDPAGVGTARATVDTLPSSVIRVRNPDPRDARLPTWSIVEESRIGSIDEPVGRSR